MNLTLRIKTKNNHWKWDINRTLKLLSYPLIATMIWLTLVSFMCVGQSIAWI